MNTKILVTLPLLTFLAACTNTGASYVPIVDGNKNASFKPDLAACKQVAKSRKLFNAETRQHVAVGAAAGAILGSAESRQDAVGGAVVGALGGGLVGASDSIKERKSIVIECMKQRGHRVVG